MSSNDKNIFVNKSIDLVRTFDNFDKGTPKKSLWNDNFGASIVNLALGVVCGYNREKDIGGIKLCLKHLICKLQRKHYFLKIACSTEDIGDSIKIYKLDDLLVDSLIYSVIEFRDHLNEHHLGLSNIVRFKLIYGFELACLWASSGVSLNPKDNDWVTVRNNDSFSKYIYSNN